MILPLNLNLSKLLTGAVLFITPAILFSNCSKKCEPSTLDCTVILYKCEEGQEVCGCDNVTYACATEAECVGKIKTYKKGKCK